MATSQPFEHQGTPNIPVSKAILQLQSSVVIDAPIQDVWDALTDTSTWSTWNKFVPRVTIREQPATATATDTTTDTTTTADTDTTTDTDTDKLLVSPRLQLGSRLTFHCHMKASSPDPQPEQNVSLRVTEYEAPDPTAERRRGRIVWANDAPAQGVVMSSLLTAERVHELLEVEDRGDDGELSGRKRTEVRNWECQVGYLAYVVRWLFGARLKENFEIWVQGLKEYVEAGGRESRG